MAKLILASESAYKKRQLEQLKLPFLAVSPDVDETALSGESPRETAIRLAQKKASAIANSHPNDIVIGCDQSADLNEQILGKPLTVERARTQLAMCSNQAVSFHSAVCLMNGQGRTTAADLVTTVVKFRKLSTDQINTYIEKEHALDCAGGFKMEGLGITLFEEISSSDPSALIGLPLIATYKLLREAGLDALMGN